MVCGCVCLSVLFVWWGVLRPLPPRSGGGGGYRYRWGVCCGGGWHGEEGRGVRRDIPVRVLVSPSVVVVSLFAAGVPLVVHPVVLLKGGVCWCVVFPVFISPCCGGGVSM